MFGIITRRLTLRVNPPEALYNEENNDFLSDRLIHRSDIAVYNQVYGIWINGTQPALAAGQFVTPDNTFPFTRLASVASADQSVTFLYHQINGTTLAEEQYDASQNTWLPSEYISVSDS